LTVDWYNKKTSDILQNTRVADYLGYVSDPAANVASMTNKGLEIEVGYKKKVGEWNFGINGNTSYLKNEVTYLGNDITFLSNQQNFQGTSYPIARTAIGQPVFAYYGFKTAGIFQNQTEVDQYVDRNGSQIQPNARPGDFRWEDINQDGKIDENDRTFLGSPIPKWTYGITLNAAYKGFDFMAFGQGVGGNKIFQGLRRLDISGANWQQKALGRWTTEGSTHSHPRLSEEDSNKNFTNPSNFYIEDGAYFRLKVMQLGYTFKPEWTQRIGAKSLRLYLMSENLFTITKYTGYDPEIGGDQSDRGMGIDRGIYPQARSFMFGLNVGF